MASEPILVDSLVKGVNFILLNHEDIDPNTDQQVRWALDAVLNEMVVKTQFAAFKRYDSFTVRAGIHTYSMPDDFVQVLGYGLQYATSPFKTLDWMMERDFLECEMERNQQSGEPLRFFITHKDAADGLWRFRVHPTPSADRVINRCYLSMPTPIRLTIPGGDHELDRRFPVQQIRALICGAATHFPQYVDPATLQANLMLYQKAISDMSQKSEPVAGNLLQKRAYGGPMRVRSFNYPTVNFP